MTKRVIETIKPDKSYLAMVIDDDVMIRILVRETLESRGLEVVEAESGKTGFGNFFLQATRYHSSGHYDAGYGWL